MPHFRRSLFPAALFITLTTTLGGHAQPGRAASPIQASLQWLVARSPVILAGEVVAPDPAPGDTQADPSLATVSLRVEAGVRGARTGDVISLRQVRGSEAFLLAPHERVLLFLRPRNAAGIASSAYGSFGLLRVGGGDRVDLRPLVLLAAQLRPPGAPLLEPPPIHRAPCHRPLLRPIAGARPQWLEGCDPGVGLLSTVGKEGGNAMSTRQLIEANKGPQNMPIKQLIELVSRLTSGSRNGALPVRLEVRRAR